MHGCCQTLHEFFGGKGRFGSAATSWTLSPGRRLHGRSSIAWKRRRLHLHSRCLQIWSWEEDQARWHHATDATFEPGGADEAIYCNFLDQTSRASLSRTDVWSDAVLDNSVHGEIFARHQVAAKSFHFQRVQETNISGRGWPRPCARLKCLGPAMDQLVGPQCNC